MEAHLWGLFEYLYSDKSWVKEMVAKLENKSSPSLETSHTLPLKSCQMSLKKGGLLLCLH